MLWDPVDEVWMWPCRCGDAYSLRHDDVIRHLHESGVGTQSSPTETDPEQLERLRSRDSDLDLPTDDAQRGAGTSDDLNTHWWHSALNNLVVLCEGCSLGLQVSALPGVNPHLGGGSVQEKEEKHGPTSTSMQ